VEIVISIKHRAISNPAISQDHQILHLQRSMIVVDSPTMHNFKLRSLGVELNHSQQSSTDINLLTGTLLVVEPNYLPDSEVLAFSRVYTPCSIYTPEVCTLFHAGECRGGVPPLQGPGGLCPQLGGLGASRPPAGVRG
jgi:hypothetical protein